MGYRRICHTRCLRPGVLTLIPYKKRAPEEQNRNEPERIEQIGQVRGPIGYITRDAWEAGKDVAQEEGNDSVEDHRARYEPNREHPGPPQPETYAGGDVERAEQERILDSACKNARVHLQNLPIWLLSLLL